MFIAFHGTTSAHDLEANCPRWIRRAGPRKNTARKTAEPAQGVKVVRGLKKGRGRDGSQENSQTVAQLRSKVFDVGERRYCIFGQSAGKILSRRNVPFPGQGEQMAGVTGCRRTPPSRFNSDTR